MLIRTFTLNRSNTVHLFDTCRQEGWRLEHENLNAPDSPIQFKGIVFNEMKGVFVSTYIFQYTN